MYSGEDRASQMIAEIFNETVSLFITFPNGFPFNQMEMKFPATMTRFEIPYKVPT